MLGRCAGGRIQQGRIMTGRWLRLVCELDTGPASCCGCLYIAGFSIEPEQSVLLWQDWRCPSTRSVVTMPCVLAYLPWPMQIVMADEADVFWPPHAEAYALLARAFQLTWAKPARDLQAPSTVSTLDSIQARMDAIVVDQQARPTADDEMQDLLLSVNYQLQALRMAMDCNATKNATSCDSWRDFMEEVMSKYPGYASEYCSPEEAWGQRGAAGKPHVFVSS